MHINDLPAKVMEKVSVDEMLEHLRNHIAKGYLASSHIERYHSKPEYFYWPSYREDKPKIHELSLGHFSWTGFFQNTGFVRDETLYAYLDFQDIKILCNLQSEQLYYMIEPFKQWCEWNEGLLPINRLIMPEVLDYL